jgi:hypothetical protein
MTFRILALYLFLPAIGMAQSPKDLRQAQVKSCMVTKSIPAVLGAERIPERKDWYDAQGQLIEQIRYSKTGEIEKHQKFYRAEDGSWKAEVEIKPGKSIRIDSIVDKKGSSGEWVRTEKYNSKGDLQYYEAHRWDKGLKVETQRFNAKDVLQFTKTYQYIYP